MINIIKFLKTYYKFIICLICLISFTVLTKFIQEKEILEIDKIIYNFISNNFMSKKMNYFMLFITVFADKIVLISLCFLLIILLKSKNLKILILLNLLFSSIINNFLKFIFKRPRPIINILEKGYSYPSGHSMVAFAFYGLLIYLIYKNVKNKNIKYFLIIMLNILILLIGISRIYLGAHYASDVIGGYLIAFIYLLIFKEILNFIHKKNVK